MADQQEPLGSFNAISSTNRATLAVALISVTGLLFTTWYNADAQRELERDQFESNLILKAVGTEDKKLSRDNFRFLIESGLIRRKSEKIGYLLQDTSFHIHFPADRSDAQEMSPTIPYSALSTLADQTFSGIVVDKKTLQPIKGATVSITTNRSRRRPIETKTTDFYGRFTLHYPLRDYTLKYDCPGYVEEESFHYMAIKFKKPLIIKMQRFVRY